MADRRRRLPYNVPGHYVDDNCTDCDACRHVAPANFSRNDETGYAYVSKQPTTPEEEALCREAIDGCPVEAIGADGEGPEERHETTPTERAGGQASLANDGARGTRPPVPKAESCGNLVPSTPRPHSPDLAAILMVVVALVIGGLVAWLTRGPR